jgi:hypothetical protein
VITPTLPLVSTMMCSNVPMILTPCFRLPGNVPASGDSFKWAPLGADQPAGQRLHCLASDPMPAWRCQVMNIRAAEAIVSSAPNPMKSFPIREAWSQTELSPDIVAAGDEPMVAAAVELPCCSFRSPSLS